MSATQVLRQQVRRHLAEHAKHPSRAKTQQAECRLSQPVAQGAFALLLGQFVGVQPPLHGGRKAHQGGDLPIRQVRLADLVVPVGVSVVDQFARGPVVGLRGRGAIQQPEVCALETL